MRLFGDPASGIDDPWLARACRLAEQGRGKAAPNPLVGCVIARGDAVLGEGAHTRAGEPHAEVLALREARDEARGATAYVTLEPCTHEGRTPPCTEALLSAGVSRVVIGMADPNPLVSGGGATRLEADGIEVAFAEDPSPFRAQNAAWLTRVREGRPLVTVKVAVSLDGKVALVPGASARISGEGGRAITRRLRAGADAVLVGARTLSIDDPALTRRDASGKPDALQPLRVVLARDTLPDPYASIFGDGLGPVLVLVSDAVPVASLGDLMARGAEVHAYETAGGLGAAFRAIASRGVNEVLVEAGPGLFTALCEEVAVDRLVLVHGGGLAGTAAPGLFVGTASGSTDRLDLSFAAVEAGVEGSDAVTVWEPLDRV